VFIRFGEYTIILLANFNVIISEYLDTFDNMLLCAFPEFVMDAARRNNVFFLSNFAVSTANNSEWESRKKIQIEAFLVAPVRFSEIFNCVRI
jgi:hypothetical protein